MVVIGCVCGAIARLAAYLSTDRVCSLCGICRFKARARFLCRYRNLVMVRLMTLLVRGYGWRRSGDVN